MVKRKSGSSDARKSLRKSSWSRGQERKEKRRQAAKTAHEHNVANGITPWQKAQALRAERRHPKAT